MEFQSRIEEELRCPRCNLLYVDAVLLSCSHSVCLQCAVHLAKGCSAVFDVKSSSNQPRPDSLTVPGAAPANGDDSTASPAVGTSRADFDRSSVGSETDSGVICTAVAGTAGSTTPSASGSSRPNSFVGADAGTPSVGNLSTASSQDSGSSNNNNHNAVQIVCPRCVRATSVDDSSVTGISGSLSRNRCLETVVDRYRDSRQIPVYCQRCLTTRGEVTEDSDGGESPAVGGKREAVGLCEQCLMFLCDRCVEAGRHGAGCTAKDPAQSVLSPVSTGKSWLAAVTRSRAVSCVDHVEETLGLYCVDCHVAICCLCADVTNGGSHSSHHTKPLGAVSKSHKVSILFSLHGLDEFHGLSLSKHLTINHYCSLI